LDDERLERLRRGELDGLLRLGVRVRVGKRARGRGRVRVRVGKRARPGG